MPWKRLLPTSLLCATAAVVSISFLTPSTARAVPRCGAYTGAQCDAVCNRDCSDGSCCSYSYYYLEEPTYD